MTKAKVYIAGKITGDAEAPRKFREAQDRLEAEGFIVLNPTCLPEGMSRADYMRVCFAMIDVADTVAFMEGFLDSPGAMLELQYCKYIGKNAFMVRSC